jgi:hypothetical protein
MHANTDVQRWLQGAPPMLIARLVCHTDDVARRLVMLKGLFPQVCLCARACAPTKLWAAPAGGSARRLAGSAARRACVCTQGAIRVAAASNTHAHARARAYAVEHPPPYPPADIFKMVSKRPTLLLDDDLVEVAAAFAGVVEKFSSLEAAREYIATSLMEVRRTPTCWTCWAEPLPTCARAAPSPTHTHLPPLPFLSRRIPVRSIMAD